MRARRGLFAAMATDQERLLLLVEAQTRNFERAMRQASSVADVEASRVERRFNQMNRNVRRDFDNFANQTRAAVATLGVGIVARDVVQLGDTWTTVGNRLAFAGVASERLAQSQQDVADIASRTRSDLDAVADLYARMFRSSEDLGLSQERVLRLTETVSQALAGASQAERASAVRQFGQGLGSGRFQGDELRSILENSRPIAEAIADEFGVAVGALKDLGAQGELTSNRVVAAIERAAPQIAAAFEQTNFTVADSFTRLRTEAARFIGTNDLTSASIRGLSGFIDLVANNFDLLADAIIVTASVLAGGFAGAAVARAGSALLDFVGQLGTATARTVALRGALSALGGPLGILGGVLAVVATQTDIFASASDRAARTASSMREALSVIADLEVVTDGSAGAATDLAEALGQAEKRIKDMADASADATGNLTDQEVATRGLAAAERELAIATLTRAQNQLRADIRAEDRGQDYRNLQRFLNSDRGVGLPNVNQRRNLERLDQQDADGQERRNQLLTDELFIREAIVALRDNRRVRRRAPEDPDPDPDPTGSAGVGRQALSDLRASAEISLARLRHDEARVRALQDAEEITNRTAAYIDADLSAADARQIAEAEVTAERQAFNAEAQRSFELSQLQDSIDLARIQNNVGLADSMSDQLEIATRTRDIVGQLAVSEEKAAQMAREYVEARREAINQQRAYNLEMRALQDDAEIARLRGDAAAERSATRRADLEARIRELRDEGLTADVAAAKAEAEIAALEQADFQGQFRRWFTGGITAALEGDLDDFFETWIRDRAAAGLESALNQVADILFESFQGILTNVIRGGQDGLGQAVSAVFSGGASAGLNQLGDGATKAGEALGVVLAASAAEAGSKIAITGAIAAASAAKESASAASKSAASLSVTSSSLILAKSLLAAASAAQVFAASSGGGKSGITGLVTSVIGSVLKFGGGKANGGMVSPGNWYNVGERGPERFVPSVPGYIVPNGGFGGGAPVVNVVDRSVYNITGASTAEVAQLRAQMRNDQATRRQQTIGHVREALRRPRVLG